MVAMVVRQEPQQPQERRRRLWAMAAALDPTARRHPRRNSARSQPQAVGVAGGWGALAAGALAGAGALRAASSLREIHRGLGLREGLPAVLRSRTSRLLGSQPRPPTTLPPTTSVVEVARVLRLEGVVVVEGLASPELCDRAEAELAEHYEDERTGGATSSAAGWADFTGRIGSMIERLPCSSEFAAHPLVLGAAEELLLPHCKKIQFKVTETIRNLPHPPDSDVPPARQNLHQEETLWPIGALYGPGEEITVDAIWALSDFTAANGATHCIPGSNLWARLPPGESPSNDLPTVQAEMRRGSVILFTGSLIHAGGTNQTDMPRLGLALSYQAGFLRGETNHVLNVPPERARSLPIAVQELLGYPLRHSGNMMDLFGDGPYRGGSSYAYTGAGKGGRSRLVDAEAQPPELVVPLDTGSADGELAREQYDHTEGDNYRPQAARSSAPRSGAPRL